jgi:plasmid maintenance system antidote protein VapI
MAINGAAHPPDKPIEEIYEAASASVAAKTLLDAMGPQLKRAMALRMKALFDAAPELGPLLDARAQLKAVYDMQQGLEREEKSGRGAVERMTKLLLQADQ